jgi:predicted DsbA family dithiol-disulfide isomerase
MLIKQHKIIHSICAHILLMSLLMSCQPTIKTSIHSMPQNCDTLTGACALPLVEPADSLIAPVLNITIDYFTDPICSSCWGFEPQLRRLKLEYGHAIAIRYCMGGLLPDWSYNSGGISKPSDVFGHWREVAEHYEMPIDGSVWLNDPLHSSYPPSIAFKAAQLQDEGKSIALLRRMREMVFIENRNIAQWTTIAEAAQAIGLDTAVLHNDFKASGQIAFDADLKYTRQNGVRGFPTLIVRFPNGKTQMIYGSQPYAAIARALKNEVSDLQAMPYPQTMSHLLQIFPTWTAKEVSVVLDITFAQAEEKLREAAAQGQLVETKIVNGSIWRKR